jgi:integrase/recombinase XerD
MSPPFAKARRLQMSPLRPRMIQDMTVRSLSRATQQSHIYAIAKFSRHFRAYQQHLVVQKYSWARINQVACAMRFFYGITLGEKEAFERIVRQGAGEASAEAVARA